MKKFEYKTAYVGEKGQATNDFILNGIDQTKLNELGKEGWELINIHNTNPQDYSSERFTNYYFKKEIK